MFSQSECVVNVEAMSSKNVVLVVVAVVSSDQMDRRFDQPLLSLNLPDCACESVTAKVTEPETAFVKEPESAMCLILSSIAYLNAKRTKGRKEKSLSQDQCHGYQSALQQRLLSLNLPDCACESVTAKVTEPEIAFVKEPESATVLDCVLWCNSKNHDYPLTLLSEFLQDRLGLNNEFVFGMMNICFWNDDLFEVLDEPTGKTKDTSEGTGVKPGVLDVSKEVSSNSDDDSWGDSEDESDDVHDEDDNDDDDGNDDDSGNDDGGENMCEEEDDDVAKELYGDLIITQGLRDTDMTNVEQGGVDKPNYSHESGFVHKEEDAHVTLTTVHDKTEGPLQSSSVSSNFTSKLLNLEDPSPDINSLMDTSTVPQPPPPVNPSSHLTIIPQQQTPDSITATTNPMMTLPEIPNFASLFQFDQRVSALETKVSEFNQRSQFAEAISLIPSIVDNYLAFKLKEEVNVAAIIREHVKAQVSKIMPHIEKYVTEALRTEVSVRLTNQPPTSYAVAASLSEFELKKILIDKMETNESINRSDIQRNLYDALVESYNTDIDILSTYGDVVTLKRGRDDQYKDEDPSLGSDRRTKRRQSSRDAEPSKGSKSKESKSSSSYKGTQSQPKSSGKYTQGEELKFEAANTEMQQDQGNESGHIDDQPDNEAASTRDWFQKLDKPPTPDRP
nr:hypothetical protein [Tanacetum cinerariifolium]